MKTPDPSVEARLQLLEAATKAQENIAFAIAITLDQPGRMELVKTLQVIQLNVAAKDSLHAAQGIQHFINRLLAVSAPGAPSPLLTMAVEASLFAQAKPGQKEALQSWLAIATPEELFDDVGEALPLKRKKPAAGGKRGKG
jgi:hypothetical protein